MASTVASSLFKVSKWTSIYLYMQLFVQVVICTCIYICTCIVISACSCGLTRSFSLISFWCKARFMVMSLLSLQVFMRMGLPRVLLSDNGSELCNALNDHYQRC